MKKIDMTSFNKQLLKYCVRHWVFYISNCLGQLGQLEIRLINLVPLWLNYF